MGLGAKAFLLNLKLKLVGWRGFNFCLVVELLEPFADRLAGRGRLRPTDETDGFLLVREGASGVFVREVDDVNHRGTLPLLVPPDAQTPGDDVLISLHLTSGSMPPTPGRAR